MMGWMHVYINEYCKDHYYYNTTKSISLTREYTYPTVTNDTYATNIKKY